MLRKNHMITEIVDGNSLLSNVFSKYGAPMGRRNIEKNPNANVTLFLMRMVDNDYDTGGAYWGGTETPMYAAIGDDFEFYLRANSLTEAKLLLLQTYPKLQINFTEVNDDFVSAYLDAILFYSNDNDDEPLSDNYNQEDFAHKTINKVREDCGRFLKEYGHLITSQNCIDGEEWQLAGYDFFHTRNGTGVGFWDGDWEDTAAKLLTQACKKFGSVDFYIGDDGKIYC